MARQLIYASSATSLDPGRTGLSTVARHRDLAPALIALLEKESPYQPREGHPAIYRYRLIAINGQYWGIMSRLVDAGPDYSGRRSGLAHHLILEESEFSQATNPASFMLAWKGWLNQWEGEPRFLGEQDAVDVTTVPAVPGLYPDDGYRRRESELVTPGGHSNRCLMGGFTDPRGQLTLFAAALRECSVEQRWRIPFTTHWQEHEELSWFRWAAVPQDNPSHYRRSDYRWVGHGRRPSTNMLPQADNRRRAISSSRKQTHSSHGSHWPWWLAAIIAMSITAGAVYLGLKNNEPEPPATTPQPLHPMQEPPPVSSQNKPPPPSGPDDTSSSEAIQTTTSVATTISRIKHELDQRLSRGDFPAAQEQWRHFEERFPALAADYQTHYSRTIQRGLNQTLRELTRELETRLSQGMAHHPDTDTIAAKLRHHLNAGAEPTQATDTALRQLKTVQALPAGTVTFLLATGQPTQGTDYREWRFEKPRSGASPFSINTLDKASQLSIAFTFPPANGDLLTFSPQEGDFRAGDYLNVPDPENRQPYLLRIMTEPDGRLTLYWRQSNVDADTPGPALLYLRLNASNQGESPQSLVLVNDPQHITAWPLPADALEADTVTRQIRPAAWIKSSLRWHSGSGRWILLPDQTTRLPSANPSLARDVGYDYGHNVRELEAAIKITGQAIEELTSSETSPSPEVQARLNELRITMDRLKLEYQRWTLSNRIIQNQPWQLLWQPDQRNTPQPLLMISDHGRPSPD